MGFDQIGEAISADDVPHLDPQHAARLATLFAVEYKKVVRFLVAKTGSWSEARDVAAQAFSQLLVIKDPENIRQLDAYVYRMANNIAHDRNRLGAIHGRLHKLLEHEVAKVVPSPEPSVIRLERLQLLQKAMGELDPVLRNALRMRYWDGKSFEEITAYFATQGIRVNDRTVRRWVAKALEQCQRKILHAEGEEGSP